MDSFKKKLNKFIKKHGKAVVISWNILLVVALAGLVLGYGLTDGWYKVGQWFLGKYAFYCYCAAFFYVCAMVGISHYLNIQKEIDKYGDGK
jgi:hypothetical protein